MATITLAELHGTTDEIVRRAGVAPTPTYILDSGRVVAVITNPMHFPAPALSGQRKRNLLPAFRRYMSRPVRTDIQDDLAAVREDR